MSERSDCASRASRVFIARLRFLVIGARVINATRRGWVDNVGDRAMALPVATLLLCHTVAGKMKPGLVEDCQVTLVEPLRVERAEQVRPPLDGPAETFVTPPPFDRAVMPGQQYRGDGAAAPGLGTGVGRAFEDPLGEGVFLHRAGVADDPGQQPADRLGDDQHRYLPAREDVVAEADLVDRHP